VGEIAARLNVKFWTSVTGGGGGGGGGGGILSPFLAQSSIYMEIKSQHGN
jgi:hypothetical protein